MPSRVLIVPDKFKGTLTARQAADAISDGWHESRPHDELEVLPMSDGGDGFGEVMSQLIGAVPRAVKTSDAAHRPCVARWWWQPRTKTAILDTAGVVGLAMLPAGRFHPFGLDTFGLGKVLKRIVELGAQRCLVGLGGSATNDAGFGLARALGWDFVSEDGSAIQTWPQLTQLAGARPPAVPLSIRELVVAVDVQNPLLGPRGATRVYGPQKGLKPTDFSLAETAFRRLSGVVKKHKRVDLSKVPGAGAAGGLGFGFLAFVGGRLEPGFDLFAKQSGLERKIRAADVVITGEGAMDLSTFMGKGAGRVAQLCSELSVPCLGLAGSLGVRVARRKLFRLVRTLTGLTTPARAKEDAQTWLGRVASNLATEWTALSATRRGPLRRVRHAAAG
jgi:glycerate kinase